MLKNPRRPGNNSLLRNKTHATSTVQIRVSLQLARTRVRTAGEHNRLISCDLETLHIRIPDHDQSHVPPASFQSDMSRERSRSPRERHPCYGEVSSEQRRHEYRSTSNKRRSQSYRESYRSRDEDGLRQRRDDSRDRYRSDRKYDNRDREREREYASRRAAYRPVDEEQRRTERSANRDRSLTSERLLTDASPAGPDRTSEHDGSAKDVKKDNVGSTAELEEDTEAQMAAMMGFSGFSTTKGKKVCGNADKVVVATPAKKLEYRQYMNRPGGFNRPLDSATM